MKTLLTLLAVAVLAGLAGCRNLGYNERSVSDSATPNTSQSDYVRTYDQNGNPTVKQTPPASTADPASPNYHQ
jgi:hypothetical protein